MWPIILSNRLPIVALVGRYPANKLMGRGLIPARKLASRGLLSPHSSTRAYPVLSTVSSRYSSCRGRSSTRYSPVRHSTRDRSPFRVRLACVKHAASVQSEPESNSPVQICSRSLLGRNQNLKVVLFPFALRLSMNQADLRPSPFLAALGFMRLFRGAVNNFFSEPRKNFLEKLFSARLRQPARGEATRFLPPRQELFCPGCEIPLGKIRRALAEALAEALPGQSRRAFPWRGEGFYAPCPPLSTKISLFFR